MLNGGMSAIDEWNATVVEIDKKVDLSRSLSRAVYDMNMMKLSIEERRAKKTAAQRKFRKSEKNRLSENAKNKVRKADKRAVNKALAVELANKQVDIINAQKKAIAKAKFRKTMYKRLFRA